MKHYPNMNMTVVEIPFSVEQVRSINECMAKTNFDVWAGGNEGDLKATKNGIFDDGRCVAKYAWQFATDFSWRNHVGKHN